MATFTPLPKALHSPSVIQSCDNPLYPRQSSGARDRSAWVASNPIPPPLLPPRRLVKLVAQLAPAFGRDFGADREERRRCGMRSARKRVRLLELRDAAARPVADDAEIHHAVIAARRVAQAGRRRERNFRGAAGVDR